MIIAIIINSITNQCPGIQIAVKKKKPFSVKTKFPFFRKKPAVVAFLSFSLYDSLVNKSLFVPDLFAHWSCQPCSFIIVIDGVQCSNKQPKILDGKKLKMKMKILFALANYEIGTGIGQLFWLEIFCHLIFHFFPQIIFPWIDCKIFDFFGLDNPLPFINWHLFFPQLFVQH